MESTDESLTKTTLEAVIRASRDHLMITSADGQLVTASDSVCALYGLSHQQLKDMDIRTLEADNVFTPSVTLKVLDSGQPEQVMQYTHTGRRLIADGYPVYHQGRLARVISRSRDVNDLEEEYTRLQRQLDERLDQQAEGNQQLEGIEASSLAMRELTALLARVADTQATIVLLGESGVGKTSIARAVHHHRQTPGRPFIELNCAAIPDALFESEMFGYSPGAFSGAATKGKAGLIEQADGGTLFLDEIGELSPLAQSKLLQVLQDGSVTRLGSTQPRRINFRLIVATHQQLFDQVQRGHFRLDLYYRLNVIPAEIPPLRERREEIPALVKHQRQRLKQRYGASLGLDSSQWGYLMSHDWPGNIRELENYLERLCLTGRQSVEAAANTPMDANAQATQEASATHSGGTLPRATTTNDLNLARHLASSEKEILERARQLATTTRGMASLLGISQASVVRKLARHGLNHS